MFCIFFTEQRGTNLEGAMTSDRDLFARFFQGMLEQGIYLAPSPFEPGFLSTAHSETDVQTTIDAASTVLASL